MASNQENGSQTDTNQPLYLQYPVNSLWEITLSTGETVSGTVYCTDEVSNTVFLQKNLTHTTLATELRVVHASQIARSKSLPPEQGGGDQSSQSAPLPKIQKKALEEREKKAIRMAEESFRHINEKVRKELPSHLIIIDNFVFLFFGSRNQTCPLPFPFLLLISRHRPKDKLYSIDY